MKLIKINKTEVNQTREVPGLLSCRLACEVKSAQGTLDYTGPKFSPEMWHQVMSFFRWTYKEMQSESQVRLYVNTELGKWGAWAFPQEAHTGMSAKEISVQETPEQAIERFASWNSEPSGDWVYFCTVHHHCSAGAFQSGTDEKNEKTQDGLHITVGKMDAERHDFHARFYLGGNCFEPDMSSFWPVDPALAQMVPPELLDDLARYQMCEKVTVDFPNAWRMNIIHVKPKPEFGPLEFPDWGLPRIGASGPFWIRQEKALTEVARQCESESIPEADWIPALQAISENNAARTIIKICLAHGVTPGDLLEELEYCQGQ